MLVQLYRRGPIEAPLPPFGGGGPGGGGLIQQREKFRFQVEILFEDNQKTSLTYEEDQKKKLIEDVWGWIHESNELQISIKKKRA